MTGFFAELVGEILTGKGAVGQLSLETVLPRPLIGGLIAALVVFNFVTALNPAGTHPLSLPALSPSFSSSKHTG